MRPDHKILKSSDLRESGSSMSSKMANLDEILKQLPQIIFYVDHRGKVFYVNHAGFHLENEPVQGMLIYHLMPAACNKLLQTALNQAFQTSIAQQFEYLSAVNQWWHVSVKPVKKASSKVEYAVVIFSEITQAKNREATLSAFELAFKQLSAEITLVDSRGRTIFSTDPEHDKTGEIPEILRNEMTASAEQKSAFWQTIERGEIWIDSHKITDSQGHIRHMEVIVVPVLSTNFAITHHIIIRHDSTRLKTLEQTLQSQVDKLQTVVGQKENDILALNQVIEELIAARDAAQKSSRSTGDYLANLNHDIRTPVQSIISMAQLILDTPLLPAQEKYLKILRTSADHLNVLVNDLLDFAKIESGHIILTHEEFCLYKSVHDVLNMLVMRAAERKLELILDIEADVPEYAVGDCLRLQQILTNLVGNAIKFTDQGEIILRIQKRSAVPEKVTIQFSVIDTGAGIPKDCQTSVFNPYDQGQASDGQRTGGKGLGLAIAEKLVKLQKGRIWIESPLEVPPVQGGPGCAVHAELEYDLPNREYEREHPIGENETDPAVLIVESNETQRKIIEKVFHSSHVQLLSATSARAALTVMNQMSMESSNPPVVFINADLPGMGGFKLAEKILQDGELAKTVIMMLSPVDLNTTLGNCTALGITRYLIRPLNPYDMLKMIRTEYRTEETEKQPVQEVTERRTETTSGPSDRPVQSILLVDDDQSTCEFVVSYLSKKGWHVECVSEGQSAVHLFTTKKFDLVLMDVQLSGMDGLRTASAIREIEQKWGPSAVPIIALTSRSHPDDRLACIEAGMTDYIAKPVLADVLVQTIERHLNGFSEITEMPSETAINLTKALNTFHGDQKALLEEIEQFSAVFPGKMDEFKRYIQDQSKSDLEFSARELKIKAGIIGANTLYRWADQLETVAWKAHFEHASIILEKLSDAFTALSLFIKHSDLKGTLEKQMISHRILVIEDNLAYQEFLRNQLESHGYDIILAKDGLEGLELARTDKPDLIILDLMLPQINGHAVTHMLKLDRNCRHIPIMMLTCRNIEEDAKLAKKGGANTFLLKSTPTEKIMNEIKRLIVENNE